MRVLYKSAPKGTVHTTTSMQQGIVVVEKFGTSVCAVEPFRWANKARFWRAAPLTFRSRGIGVSDVPASKQATTNKV
jgi:hypothetical protein